MNISGYRAFGETTKSIATIESSVVAGTKIEVFISNIERLFQSGEFIRIVDNNLQDIIIDDQPLRAKLVGQISQININPNNRGLFYEKGNPVILYDGLTSNTAIGAVAEVNETTSGSIQHITVVNGGYGYTTSPNTIINISGSDISGANAFVAYVNPSANGIANVAYVPTDSINSKLYIKLSNSNFHFSNTSYTPTVNVNTRLSDAFTFTSFATYPIAEGGVYLNNGGGGITVKPEIVAESTYQTDDNTYKYADLASLGILGPIQISNPGEGYRVNDQIVFSGGSGRGANAHVIQVSATGQIERVDYVSTGLYPTGGMSYRNTNLPVLSVVSANTQASNASLFVPSILGTNARLEATPDFIGAISTINIINYGEDYITTPNVSIKVEDILVSNVLYTNPPVTGDIIYQGDNINTASYIATVNSYVTLVNDNNPTLAINSLRVFNYNSTPNPDLQLKIDKNINLAMVGRPYNKNYFYSGSPKYNDLGIKIYGDGSAKATASFLNGLTIGKGQYLNSQGKPSSFDVLQSTKYNNYTYEITVDREIAKYREVLLNLLHPTGMKMIGRYSIHAEGRMNTSLAGLYSKGLPLYSLINSEGATAEMYADFDNKSNNTIQFNNLSGANLANIMSAGNSIITITPTNGPDIYSKVIEIDSTNNIITLDSNTWLTYSNVAVVSGQSGSNLINILEYTGAYDIINFGNYIDPNIPLLDIVFAGDHILVDNNTSKLVESIDYANGTITLTTNLTDDTNSYMAVNRTFSANSSLVSNQIKIYS